MHDLCSHIWKEEFLFVCKTCKLEHFMNFSTRMEQMKILADEEKAMPFSIPFDGTISRGLGEP